MTTRLILAIALCAGMATACDDAPTTPAAPSPADGTAEAAQASRPAGAGGGETTSTEQMARGSGPALAPSTMYSPTGRASDDVTNDLGDETWTDPNVPVRNLGTQTVYTHWLSADSEPVMVGSWTQVQSCSGSNCWTHEDTDPHNWEQVNNCAESPTWPSRRCWELTRNSGDGVVTVRFSRSGHTTNRQGAGTNPWTATYAPNGYGTHIDVNSCTGTGVATPVECTFTIPPDACEAPEMYYGWRLPALCRVALATLETRTGTRSSHQAYRHQVCLRTRATFDGETVTSDFGTCR